MYNRRPEAVSYSALELIDLADKQGYIIISVGSSIIDTISYDLMLKNLVVTLTSNDDYVYYNVSFHKFYKFVNAESKGSFYNLYVRGRW